jgi:hypothetical protein
MRRDQGGSQELAPPARPGLNATALVAVFYTFCVSIATWPRVLLFRSSLPSLGDPLQHLWIMRWYRTCLFEGRSPFLCPEIQYPVGGPLGCFSPLQFQALLYIPLSLLIRSDVLCYNLLWMFGIVTTGLGTFLLAWRVTGDRVCAAVGGMLAMLSAPMLFHASAHLELIYLGAFPLFLWTWLKLCEEPSRRRLVAAVGAYVLLASCAAYFAVYAVFPAALYFVWRGVARGWRGAWPWFRNRLGWLAVFSALVVPCLAILFGNQIWALAQGYALPHPVSGYQIFNTPLWCFAVPTGVHALGRAYPSSWYVNGGPPTGECCSYLGVVTLGLLAYAAALHVRFRDAWYWWACLVLLVVLSGGTAWTIAGHEIPLPGRWLKENLVLFRMIRVPSRFNLFAAVVAGVVAAGGLRHLLAHLRWRWLRGVVLAGLTAGAVADLAMVPYSHTTIPNPPGCYTFLQRTAPGAAFLEVPQSPSTGTDTSLSAFCGYWQSFHRGRTNAGYCGHENVVFDNLLTRNSPFLEESISRPDFLADPKRTPIPLQGHVDFGAYAWLYLTVHGYRFLVLHQEPELVAPWPGLARLKKALAPARVYEDARSVVYDRERLPRPRDPVMITTRGWRKGSPPGPPCVTDREARLVIFNPEAGQDLYLAIDAQSLGRARHVRLISEGEELSRWEVPWQQLETFANGPFRLRAGLHELVLESDRVTRPRKPVLAAGPSDTRPYSLRVKRLALDAGPTVAERTDENIKRP